VTIPAVAEKSAEVDPAATVTEVGTERLALERATALPLAGAAMERVTEQVVLAFAVKVVVAHWTDERAKGAIKARGAVLETPAREAVMAALRSATGATSESSDVPYTESPFAVRTPTLVAVTVMVLAENGTVGL
jgi:hypothetical protein